MNTCPDIELKKIPVLDSFMAYREAGNPDGSTILFLHGNPTSSYLWRNILPLVAPAGHCIAPDLIGFGQSGKPGIAYRFFDQVRYLDAFLDRVNLKSACVVAHDWGTALAFHLAARRPAFIRALAFMEFTRPMPTWDDFHPEAVDVFKKFRTPGIGEKMILEDNLFIEAVLPGATVRQFTEAEMTVYRAPFLAPESRRPMWRLPNDLPIANEPADVYLALEEAHRALAVSKYPKLLFMSEPGALVSPALARQFAQKLTGCELIHIGAGIHYLPEDNPQLIGVSIREWLTRLNAH